MPRLTSSKDFDKFIEDALGKQAIAKEPGSSDLMKRIRLAAKQRRGPRLGK